MTYLQEIEEIIKNHPELPQNVIEDVQHRVSDWMGNTWATKMDNYLLAQLRYLNRAIENGNTNYN